MIILFFGPPGAGKGTQATLTANYLKIPHLSTGDILRKKMLDTDVLSKKLKEIIQSGNLVSDDILNEIVANRIINKDCSNGFILDGYPRTTIQNSFIIDCLDKKKLNISIIFDLKVDHNLIIQRINSRSSIENREDDNEEIVKTRIMKYNQETKPISDFYSINYPDNYYLINGNQEIEMIQQDIIKIAKNRDFQ
jgi:adenylate kinase